MVIVMFPSWGNEFVSSRNSWKGVHLKYLHVADDIFSQSQTDITASASEHYSSETFVVVIML